jgi:raffinose/stachyose/melibiose transport system substrate-binding protein
MPASEVTGGIFGRMAKVRRNRGANARGPKALGVVLVAGTLLAGLVSTTAATSASAASKITLSFEYQQPTPGAPNWLITEEKGFEKLNPGVSFQTADTLPSNDYLAKLSSQVGAGTAPDTFIGWTYNRLTPYAEGGRITNLTPLLSSSAAYKKVAPFALQAATVKGGVYAIPLTNDAEVIYYNKAVFAKNHITVPKTYAQFLSDITALKKGGVAPIALGDTDSFNGSILYTMLAERIGGFKLYQSTVADQKTKFDNPAFVKAGTDLQNLVHMGAFNSNYASQSIGYAASLLTTGKAGMFINGTWETYALNQGLGKNLGWFTLPPIPGGADQSPQQLIELPNNAISISAHSSNQAMAVKWIEYLLSEPAQVVEAKAGNALATTYTLPAGTTDPTTTSIHAATSTATQAMAPWDTLLGVYLGEQFDNTTQQLYAGKSPSSELSAFDGLVSTNGGAS